MSSKAQNPWAARIASCRCTWQSPRKNPQDCARNQFKSTPPIFDRKPAQSLAFRASFLQLTGQQCELIRNFEPYVMSSYEVKYPLYGCRRPLALRSSALAGLACQVVFILTDIGCSISTAGTSAEISKYLAQRAS